MLKFKLGCYNWLGPRVKFEESRGLFLKDAAADRYLGRLTSARSVPYRGILIRRLSERGRGSAVAEIAGAPARGGGSPASGEVGGSGLFWLRSLVGDHK